MIKLFSINHDRGVHHLIEIDDAFVIRDDEFLSIEIGNGFNWKKHSQKCEDCRSFLNAIKNPKNAFDWYVQSSDGTYILNMSDFSSNDHFKNLYKLQISRDFTGVKLKLKKELENFDNLERLIAENESKENYEACVELKKAISIINRQ